MTKQNRDYSSIKSHKELLQAISDINQQIRLQSTILDSAITSIKYKYSFAHVMEICVTKYQIFAQTFKNVILLINKIRGISSKNPSHQKQSSDTLNDTYNEN